MEQTANQLDLSVILPSYLEEENLRVLLPRLTHVLQNLGIKWEILVIDTTQQMDNTKMVTSEFGTRYINRQPNNFFGSAVRTGIDHANGKLILFMDADGSHSPEFIPRLMEKAKIADVVIASRYIEGGATENKKSLMLMSRILNLSYSIILGLDCKDVSNSFKLYESKKLKEIELTCNNFDIVEEILFKIKTLNPNLKIVEIPFCFKERMFGQTKRNLLSFIFTYIFTLIRLRFGKIRRKPSQGRFE